MAEKKIVFADNTDLVIREESYSGDQIVDVAEWTGIKPILDRFTRANLADWYYTLNGVKSVEVDFFNYRLSDVQIFATDGGFVVHFHTEAIPEIDLLRERLAELETSQEDQNSAIDYLLMGGLDEEEEEVDEPVDEPVDENESGGTEEGAESEVE